GQLTVCDLSTYLWSSTLKDPRSWAVMCLALKYGVRHLGVWTAGNAGYSLARLAYAVNRLLPPDRRVQVHCYYDGKEESLPRGSRYTLRGFQANLLEIPTLGQGTIFTPEYALECLNATRTSHISQDDYWEVTDGWDGVGILMYRLLARQVCTH